MLLSPGNPEQEEVRGRGVGDKQDVTSVLLIIILVNTELIIIANA